MINLMLDIETMGTGYRPAIIQISCVAFDDDFITYEEFNVGVSLVSSIMSGLTVTQGTIDFWKHQSIEAQNTMVDLQEGSLPLKSALLEFIEFIDDCRDYDDDNNITLWGNGMISDNLWLYSACEAVGINLENHVNFWEHSCFRQEMTRCHNKYGIKPNKVLKFNGTMHDALDDCKHQIRAMHAYSVLERTDPENLKDVIEHIEDHTITY